MTLDNLKQSIKQLECLERAGAGRDVSDASLGSDMLIWRKFRDGSETWEVAPRVLAEHTVAAIPYNEPEVERAKLYEKPPANAPRYIKEHFRMVLMMTLFAFAPVLTAA